MKLAALVSGGKDSIYSVYLAKKAGHEIDYILTMKSENLESYMFHTHNLHILENIAHIMKTPIVFGETKGVKEEELTDLKHLLEKVKDKVDGVTTGAIASTYQKSRVDKICQELGLESLAPLWGLNPEEILRNMLKDNFEIIIISVGAPPLDETWLGRKIDKKCIEDLVNLNKAYGIHVAGEGGEIDTLVLSCPLYNNKKITIENAEKIWDKKTKSGSLNIKNFRVENQ